MPTLAEYQQQLTDLIHDSGGQFYSVGLQTRAINLARKQVAKDGRCLRVLTPPGTSVGQMATVASQEAYQFSDYETMVQTELPGVDKIQSVAQVAISWGGYIPAMIYAPWGQFQAYYRAVNFTGIEGFPAVWSIYGAGAVQSIYLYPIPTQAMAMLWDTVCSPIDLVDDTTIDALPYPYDEAVKHWAASYCYLNSQRRQDSNAALNDYKMKMREANVSTQPWMVPNWYRMRMAG